jgi:hypothetical protein
MNTSILARKASDPSVDGVRFKLTAGNTGSVPSENADPRRLARNASCVLFFMRLPAMRLQGTPAEDSLHSCQQRSDRSCPHRGKSPTLIVKFVRPGFLEGLLRCSSQEAGVPAGMSLERRPRPALPTTPRDPLLFPPVRRTTIRRAKTAACRRNPENSNQSANWNFSRGNPV